MKHYIIYRILILLLIEGNIFLHFLKRIWILVQMTDMMIV